MIKELIEFGEFLHHEGKDDFCRETKDNDLILTVSFKNNNFLIGNIVKKNNFESNYFDKSLFYEDFFISTNQNIMIPSNQNLLGLTPFFIKLDHNFIKNGIKDIDSIKKFKNKINRSVNANSNNREFIEVLNFIYADYTINFLDKCSLKKSQSNEFEKFFNKLSHDDVKDLIIDYYKFLLNNFDKIIDLIIDFKESDNYINEEKGNFYLACIFGDEKDLINDLFFYYSKFIKSRSKQIKDNENYSCSFCGEKGITYPSLQTFAISNNYSFNYISNLENSKIKICKKCNYFMFVGDDTLKKKINNHFLLIIPKKKENADFSDFLKISNKEINSFEKINHFLKEKINVFNYDLMIYNNTKNLRNVKKYIENYKAFLVKFDGIQLYNNGNLNYLFDEYITKNELNKSSINNLFDLEFIFKEFFYDIKEDKYVFPKFSNFYEIYVKDLTGKNGIFYGFDSKIVSTFSKYMYNIFNFIYEINLDSINDKMINEIVLNSLLKLQKSSSNTFNFRTGILKRLNYYFMFKKEFLSDNMLDKENIIKIKKEFSIYDEQNKNVNLTKENILNINSIIDNDIAIKYYLLGQFIRHLDNIKFSDDKNNDIFSNFINNVNRNNIKKIFVTEILQKNNFYISKMTKKGKFIFNIFENGINTLFNEKESFDYEDYLILLFTGYYTENILKKDYNYEGE